MCVYWFRVHRLAGTSEFDKFIIISMNIAVCRVRARRSGSNAVASKSLYIAAKIRAVYRCCTCRNALTT